MPDNSEIDSGKQKSIDVPWINGLRRVLMVRQAVVNMISNRADESKPNQMADQICNASFQMSRLKPTAKTEYRRTEVEKDNMNFLRSLSSPMNEKQG